MDRFHQRLRLRAATIDERLSNAFEAGQERDDDAAPAARRLAAWRQAAANGDPDLFRRRLERDGWSAQAVLSRLATIDVAPQAPLPCWLDDAIWIEAALGEPFRNDESAIEGRPFGHLLMPVVDGATAQLWTDTGASIRNLFTPDGEACLRLMLLDQLCEMCAPPLYERFSAARTGAASGSEPATPGGAALYARFVADMKARGFRQLFEQWPVLLRLIATLTRQWIEAVCEFAVRLDADRDVLRREFAGGDATARVARVEGSLSDRHNNGRSVFIVTFEDGARVVYKPKDLRLDLTWHDLVARLNQARPPLDLRAVRAIARDGYGWTEFVAHMPCDDPEGIALYFRRAGAWLALFHCFAATDMHQENVIAAGDHPVPIDLETILQAPPSAPDSADTAGSAARAAADMIAQSVMAVGILPAYARAPDTSVFAMGALTADWNAKIQLTWIDSNSDAMRPTRTKVVDKANPNLPHIDGVYGKLADHIEALIAGFESYARFLSQYSRGADQGGMFDGFSGLPVRRVVRPTRFYSMLLQRLKTHRSMDDGAVWSAQADFIARLSDGESDSDPNWPLLRAERTALLTLNVPHFVVASDGSSVCDADGAVAQRAGPSGLAHARERVRNFDDSEIAWQTAVIRANTVRGNPAQSVQAQSLALREEPPILQARDLFTAEADRIAAEIAKHAIRRGNSAAWIGLDWMGDAEAFQLAVLGPDLYNGVSGIAVFLAAHAAVAKHALSAELARAALAQLRGKLKDRNAARFARSLGIGGATGLGSIVYALSVAGASLDDPAIVADAHVAAMLMTDELIAADKRLDALGGSAGAILGLLRLYRDTGADDVLKRALACGDHLLRNRIGTEGQRTFLGHGLGPNALNGMSHGAAGFVYALASLAAASGRGDFEQAAAEALAFENASYDANRHNWPDLRHTGEPGWACRWCHGAPGIGLARAALLKRSTIDPAILKTDVGHALAGVEAGWPAEIDTLCCGTLGSVEFVCEAADALERPGLRSEAAGKLAAVVRAAQSTGDYRWNSGERRFNLGLFRGIAGVGYTLLRRCNPALPNVLIWE